jgi:hypothetical protein
MKYKIPKQTEYRVYAVVKSGYAEVFKSLPQGIKKKGLVQDLMNDFIAMSGDAKTFRKNILDYCSRDKVLSANFVRKEKNIKKKTTSISTSIPISTDKKIDLNRVTNNFDKSN